MAPRTTDAESQTQTLLAGATGGSDGGSNGDNQTTILGKAFNSTANLAKHLPTGAVLAFEVLSPAFTADGHCNNTNRVLTMCLIVLCAFFCVLFCFTDSFREGSRIRYGFVTPSGRLCVFDGTPSPATQNDPERYRLNPLDFFHGFLSFIVFMSVAMVDRNIVSCFYPVMSRSTRQLLTAVPVVSGAVGSFLFAMFPSTRRGIGFPVAAS